MVSDAPSPAASSSAQPAPAHIGETFGRRVRLGVDEIRAFAASVDDWNPLHHEVAFAQAAGYPGLIASGTHYVEPMDANREDNIWVFDVRAEKTLNFGSRSRLRLFLDLFNLSNSHASETISRATGLGYQKPSAILAPRTARVGFRFLW